MNRHKCGYLITAWFYFTILFMLYGCGKQTVSLPHEEQLPSIGHSGQKKNQADIVTALKHHYKKWKGTKYRNGGLSHAGIDCSGFVRLTYGELFGVRLPRTTSDLLKKGRRVSKSSLQAGDLIFFKTGWSQKHVGIYFKDGLFIHASSSKGVVMSNLGNTYWRKRFVDAKRL